MRKNLYNIDKVKEYFWYYLHLGPNNSIPHQNITDLKKYLNHYRSDLYIFLPILILFGAMILLIGYQLGGLFGIIFGVIGIGMLVLLYIKAIIKNTERAQIFLDLVEYFEAKKELESSKEILSAKMTKDIQESGINPIEIELISKTIKQINRSLSLISGPLIEFRNADTFLKPDQKLVLEKFILIETTFLMEYIKSFQHILNTWKKNHIAELTEINQTLEKSNISSLQIASTQLEMQRKNLEQVKVQTF